jgi:hypothetical protein
LFVGGRCLLRLLISLSVYGDGETRVFFGGKRG